jgi:hypothetical protein
MNTKSKEILETVSRVIASAESSLQGMKDGERISLKDLTSLVALNCDMEAKHIIGFVTYFAHNTDLAHVTRGKNGGVVKGQPSAKADKSAKKSKVAAKNSSDSKDTSKASV